MRATVDLGLDPVLRKPQLRAFLVVANYGSKARELFVTMRQHNASDTLASRSDVVPANGKAVFELSFYPAGGDYGSGLKFELSPHDSMPVDDVAYGRVPFGPKLDVVLAANKPDSWLQLALTADPDVQLKVGSVSAVSRDTTIAPDALMVVQDACPKQLSGGDLVIVNPPRGDCQPRRWRVPSLDGRRLDRACGQLPA